MDLQEIKLALGEIKLELLRWRREMLRRMPNQKKIFLTVFLVLLFSRIFSRVTGLALQHECSDPDLDCPANANVDYLDDSRVISMTKAELEYASSGGRYNISRVISISPEQNGHFAALLETEKEIKNYYLENNYELFGVERYLNLPMSKKMYNYLFPQLEYTVIERSTWIDIIKYRHRNGATDKITKITNKSEVGESHFN